MSLWAWGTASRTLRNAVRYLKRQKLKSVYSQPNIATRFIRINQQDKKESQISNIHRDTGHTISVSINQRGNTNRKSNSIHCKYNISKFQILLNIIKFSITKGKWGKTIVQHVCIGEGLSTLKIQTLLSILVAVEIKDSYNNPTLWLNKQAKLNYKRPQNHKCNMQENSFKYACLTIALLIIN